MSTRELLIDLGFEAVVAKFTDQQPGYQYNFGNLVLKVSQVTNEYLRPVMHFTGVASTPRSIGMIEFSLLLDVESFEQGVAMIAFCLGRGFTPVRPTPWLDLGRSLEELLPGRRELRLFQQRPKCHVEAEWFRVAVKKLTSAGEAADPDSTLCASFMGDILKFELSGQCIAMPASGSAWPKSYTCPSPGLKHLSKRTPSVGIEVSIWDGRLAIGGLRLQLSPDS